MDDLNYSLATAARAGWVRHNMTPRVDWIERDNRDGGHAGTFIAPVLAYVPDADHRRDIVASVRKALGDSCNAVTGLRAARTLAAMSAHPADVAARADVDKIASDGTVPKNAAAPDAWSARSHEVVTKRTRKGRTVSEVKRYGLAPVIGSTDDVVWSSHDDAIDDDASLARSMARQELAAAYVMGPNGHTVYGARRLRNGRASLDITHVADRCYGHLGLPDLLGTDVRAFEQIVSAPADVDPADCRVAVRRSYTDDAVSVSGRAGIAGDRDEYGSHTRDLARWPDRTSRGVARRDGQMVQVFALPKGRTRSGDVSDRPIAGRLRAIGHPCTAPVLATSLRWQMIAPADVPVSRTGGHWTLGQPAHRWSGHALVARPAGSGRDVNGHRQTGQRLERAKIAKAERDARTIGGGPVREPGNVDAWRELLAAIRPGERLQVSTTEGVVTVTREDRPNGRYATSGARGRFRTRTPDSLAIRLSA